MDDIVYESLARSNDDSTSTYALLEFAEAHDDSKIPERDHVIYESITQSCPSDGNRKLCTTIEVPHQSRWYHSTMDSVDAARILTEARKANENVNYLVYKSAHQKSFVLVLFDFEKIPKIKKFIINCLPGSSLIEDGSFEVVDLGSSWRLKHNKLIYNAFYLLNVRYNGKTESFRISPVSMGQLSLHKQAMYEESDVVREEISFKSVNDLIAHYNNHIGILPCKLKQNCSKYYKCARTYYTSIYAVIHRYMSGPIIGNNILVSPFPPPAEKENTVIPSYSIRISEPGKQKQRKMLLTIDLPLCNHEPVKLDFFRAGHTDYVQLLVPYKYLLKVPLMPFHFSPEFDEFNFDHKISKHRITLNLPLRE